MKSPRARGTLGRMGSGSDCAFDAFTDRSAGHRSAEPVVHRGGSDLEHACEVRLCDLTLAQVRPERRRPASTFELGHASRLQFSESRGKRIAVNSESQPNYAEDMSADAVTGYVVMRLWAWKREGRQVKELLLRGGLNSTAGAQLMNGSTGVGPKLVPLWAKALGFEGAADLQAAAYAWFLSENPRPYTKAQREAVEVLTGLGQATEEQCRSVFGAMSHDMFRDHDAGWWANAVLTEAQRDRVEFTQLRAERKYQSEMRAVRSKGERAAEAQAAHAAAPKRKAKTA